MEKKALLTEVFSDVLSQRQKLANTMTKKKKKLSKCNQKPTFQNKETEEA